MTSRQATWLRLALYALLSIHGAAAVAQQRIEADLLGNGNTQEITLKTIPQDDFGEYEIAIGKASFRSKYFSAQGDVPEIHIVKLDKASAANQVMVSIVWAADCSFQFLSYDGAALNLLGTLESGHCLHEPEIRGNGEVVMPTWEGFWASKRIFKVSGEFKRLLPLEQRFYELDVDGVVSSRLPLFAAGSEKPTANLNAGQRVSLRRFDTRTGKYEIWIDGQARGWAQIDAQNMSGLPWAN